LDEAPNKVAKCPKPLVYKLDTVAQALLLALVVAGAPVVLGQLVFTLVSVPGINLEKDLNYIEYFSGSAVLTSSMRRSGYRAATFDIVDDAIFGDMNGDAGFAHALHLALKLRPGGASHVGIVNANLGC
jgi:hypothetical protein